MIKQFLLNIKKNNLTGLVGNVSRKMSLIQTPITIVGYQRDLVVFQGRRKSIIPNASTGLFMRPFINPFLPLPDKHKIVRVGRKKEWILLENDGILEVGIKFNISDRKKLGVNNKIRQLSLDYKVVSNNFKEVLNDYIRNGLSTPIGPPYFVSVKGVVQTFTGIYNGVKLTVPVTSQELGSNFSAILPDGNDNSNNYLKVITYKFHQAWLAEIGQPQFQLPVARQNLGTAPVTDNAVSFNPQNPFA